MQENRQLPITDKTLLTKYISSIIELYDKNLEELKDKIKNLFFIIHKSDEVSLYVHNETLRCNNRIIGYTSTMILYYRDENYWNTVPAHAVSDNRNTCMEKVIEDFLSQIPETVTN